MAIFKFYQIYRSIKSELGKDMAEKIFPEYEALPQKMPANEQAKLGKVLMERMDELLDKDTITKIRHKHCCNIPKDHLNKINELKEKHDDVDEILKGYSEFIAPGYIETDNGIVNISFGWNKCVCSMFCKLDVYETVSQTWCECCNGHVIKILNAICDQPVSSRIIETVVCGGKDCVFEVNIRSFLV